MDALQVTRWAKYGHDRLYVKTADGTRLGYLDNKTGSTVLEPGADPEAVAAALAAHCAAPTAPRPSWCPRRFRCRPRRPSRWCWRAPPRPSRRSSL